MTSYFPSIDHIPYLGIESDNALAFKYYNKDEKIFGKTMEEHLRFAVCAWHNFCWEGHDIFGDPTFDRDWLKAETPMEIAKQRADAMFEFISKLGVPYFCFHDVDVAPYGTTLQESQDNLQAIADYLQKLMSETTIKLLWGTSNLFSNKRYMAGAATNPNPEVFAYAAATVKKMMDVTKQLNGENYVFWGGREGYDCLYNTDMKRELDQLGKFLSMAVDYKHKIGFKGTLLIEPKPCEPTKHQYDHDTATVYGFLKKYDLENEFAVNIEANHATLSGHDFEHEIATAYALGIFGSIDANRGDNRLGWDTDQFPIDISEWTRVMYIMLDNGGFTTGGFNFDTKLRRQSIDAEDLFYGHISGIDTVARGLRNAASMIEDGRFKDTIEKRYAGWNSELGKNIMGGKYDLTSLEQHAKTAKLNPKPVSGQQEKLENEINHFVQ